MLIRELILQTKHIDELYAFYKNVLQFEIIKTSSKTALIKAGKTRLIFEEASNPESPFYHVAFNIPSNKIEEAFEWLKDKVQILWIEEYKSYIAEFTNWNARSVYFLDVAGNIIEFIARSDLHDAVAESFSSAHLRNISETGIVFEAERFDESVHNLMQQYQLEYFSKQPPLKHFRAIGNDEGLFIIVPEQRNWYPTNIACKIFPLSIVFENNEHSYRLQL